MNALSFEKIQQNKNDFLDVLRNTTKDVTDKMYTFLELSDFFNAPASTKYHEAYEGGLAEHSLKVYEHLVHLNYHHLLGFSESSVSKVSLLHDLCKANFYTKQNKNVKLEDGQWVRKLVWTVNDQLPLGHGDKSLALILSTGTQLTEEEMMAVRWHMGRYDASASDFAGGQALSAAMSSSKLVTALHIADMMAVWLLNDDRA